MYGITDLKTGVTVELDGTPFVVTKYQHSAMGRGGGVMKTTLKNLLTGGTIERTFQGNDKVKPADLNKSESQFLYLDDEGAHFMDPKSFDQFVIAKDVLGDAVKFLKPEMMVEVLSQETCLIFEINKYDDINHINDFQVLQEKFFLFFYLDH